MRFVRILEFEIWNFVIMLQQESKLKIVDNTGAKIGKVIRVLSGSSKKYGRIGDIVVLTVKKAEPRREIKKGDIVKALIVRQRAAFKRADQTYLRFDDNACIILEGKEPKGLRILGPVPRELKELGYPKILSIADEVV